MPSKSPAQARLMAAIAHGWKPDNMKNPPSRRVAREFNQADTGTGALSRAMRKQAGGPITEADLMNYGSQSVPGEQLYFEPTRAAQGVPIVQRPVPVSLPLEKGYMMAGMHKILMDSLKNPSSYDESQGFLLPAFREAQRLRDKKNAEDLGLLQQTEGVRQKSDFQNAVERLLRRTDPNGYWNSDARFANIPTSQPVNTPETSSVGTNNWDTQAKQSGLSPLARLSLGKQSGGRVVTPNDPNQQFRYGLPGNSGEHNYFGQFTPMASGLQPSVRQLQSTVSEPRLSLRARIQQLLENAQSEPDTMGGWDNQTRFGTRGSQTDMGTPPRGSSSLSRFRMGLGRGSDDKSISSGGAGDRLEWARRLRELRGRV